MKSEWKVKKLSEIAEFNPKESIIKGTIAKKIPMEKLQPFCRDIPEFVLEEFKGGTKFRNEDIIMARITPCLENGKTAKVNILDNDEVGFGSTEYIIFRAKKEVTDSDFLYYLVCSSIVREPAIKSMVGSSGRQRVQMDVIQNLNINVPKFEEQKKIGKLLKSIDDKIVVNIKINNNLLNQLLTLYAELILQNKICESVSLKQLCSFQEGYVNPAQIEPEYFDGDIKWLRAVDINESFIINTSRTLTNTGFQSAGKSAVLFQPNTIAISKSGTIGRLGIIADYMCGNRAVINIQPNVPQYLPFVYAFLKSKQHEFPDLAVGSVQKNLYVSVLEPLIVGLPDSTALNKFCSIGNDLLALMKTRCQETIKLTALRDALLPKLMSGEFDVSNIDV